MLPCPGLKKAHNRLFFASRALVLFLSVFETHSYGMKTHKFLKNLAILATGITFTSSAYGQLPQSKDAKFSVGDPKFDELQSPEIQDGNAKNFKPKDWLEVEVKLKVDRLREQPKDNYLDQIKVNWHIVVKGQDRKAYKISRAITYVNIPTDEEIYVSIYLSPNTLRRITGNPKASKNDLEAVGGEVELNNEMVGFFSWGEKAGWWRKELRGVEATTKFPILDKTQTPFAPLWYDRYAEVKPKD